MHYDNLLRHLFLLFIENLTRATRTLERVIQMTYVKHFLTTFVNKTTISTLVPYDM